MYRKILIASDGGEPAQRAAQDAIALAAAVGARVLAVTVSDIFPSNTAVLMPRASDVDRYEAAAATAAQKILDNISRHASAVGVDCETLHVTGAPPFEGILKASREHGCDLIAMATHGRRGLDRILLGSQASKVVADSRVPVLVCR